jgi:hypothetical protein
MLPLQNLYYYALASSPASDESDNRVRKALLRSHQPVYYPNPSYFPPPPPPQPMYVQSATASPVHPLPPFHYSHQRSSHNPSYGSSYYSTNPNSYASLSLPPIRVHEPEENDLTPYGFSAYQQPRPQASHVPVAPFANAGPPGVHWGGSQQAPSPYSWPQV